MFGNLYLNTTLRFLKAVTCYPTVLKLFIGVFLIFMSLLSTAQIKVEREYRTKSALVPDEALKFMELAGFPTFRIKWYLETDLNDTTYEAKINYRDRLYSIEFDRQGKLQDVEIEIAWTEIPLPVRENILEILEQQYDRYRIRKVQIQYSGNPESVALAIGKNFTSHELTVRYEIEVIGKSRKQSNLYEYLFSETGELLGKMKVLFRYPQHLEH